MDAVGGEGIGEGADHRLLADQILEPLRAIFARQHPIGRLRGRSPRRLGRKQGVAHRPSLARSDRWCWRRPSAGAPSRRPMAKVGGWTKTRPVSLGLLPSGPDPVGERYVLRQPPGPHVDYRARKRKGGPRGIPALGPRPSLRLGKGARRPRDFRFLQFASESFTFFPPGYSKSFHSLPKVAKNFRGSGLIKDLAPEDRAIIRECEVRQVRPGDRRGDRRRRGEPRRDGGRPAMSNGLSGPAHGGRGSTKGTGGGAAARGPSGPASGGAGSAKGRRAAAQAPSRQRGRYGSARWRGGHSRVRAGDGGLRKLGKGTVRLDRRWGGLSLKGGRRRGGRVGRSGRRRHLGLDLAPHPVEERFDDERVGLSRPRRRRGLAGARLIGVEPVDRLDVAGRSPGCRPWPAPRPRS